MSGPIVRLTETRNDAGELTHQMCAYCFAITPVVDLFVDSTGQKWDSCKPCAFKENLT